MRDGNHSFLVKIWDEPRDIADAMPISRGSIEDVQTGDRRYFSSLPELCALLEQRTGMPAQDDRRHQQRRRHWRVGGPARG